MIASTAHTLFSIAIFGGLFLAVMIGVAARIQLYRREKRDNP